jgi:hypothetical protein
MSDRSGPGTQLTPFPGPWGRRYDRLGQPEPAFGKQPAGQDIARPVDAKQDPARPDPRGRQERNEKPGGSAHPDAASTRAGGQRCKGGVLRRQAEALGLGQPDGSRWPSPRDDLRKPAACHCPAGYDQIWQASRPPASLPRSHGCEGCQQGRDKCRFGQCAHRPGRADSGRAAAPGLQSPDRCLVKAPEPADGRVGGNSCQEGERHRAVKHWPAYCGVPGSPRLPWLPGSPTCERHHGPVPQHRGPGPIGHTANQLAQQRSRGLGGIHHRCGLRHMLRIARPGFKCLAHRPVWDSLTSSRCSCPLRGSSASSNCRRPGAARVA